MYMLVQFYPVIVVPFIVCMFPPRHGQARQFVLMWALYAVAKIRELCDGLWETLQLRGGLAQLEPIPDGCGLGLNGFLQHFEGLPGSALPVKKRAEINARILAGTRPAVIQLDGSAVAFLRGGVAPERLQRERGTEIRPP